MAASGGKKSKPKWRPLTVDKVIDTPLKCNWAEEVDRDLDPGDYVTRKSFTLPTGPRSSRATVVDESKVPTNAPFQVYLSNIPYDMTEMELAQVFDDLRIKSVKLPKDDRGGNRATKGYGYVEFEDRSSLISALNQGETVVKGRPIRIELATNVDSSGRGNRGGPRGNRSDGMRDNAGPDRTSGNWRSDHRPDDDDRFERDRGGGSGAGGGRFEGGGGRREFGTFGRHYDREDRSYGRDERAGSYNREDRGFNRGSYDREDRYKDDRYSSRDDRGNQERYNRDGGFNNDRGGFRDKGFNRDDREDRGRYGGNRDERYSREDRGYGGRFEDRKGEGFGQRRDRLDSGGSKGSVGGGPSDKQRQKLVLKPRTEPVVSDASAATQSSIFGGAKPVDTAAREREIEERLAKKDDNFEGNRAGKAPTTARKSKDWSDDRKIEPAPPPKENAWSQRVAQPSVNNGRVSPDESSDSIDNRRGRYDDEGTSDTKRHESKRSDDQPSKGGNLRGGNPDRKDGRGGRDGEKQSNKTREGRRDSVEDLSRVPKVQDSPSPNFAGENKFSSLVADDA